MILEAAGDGGERECENWAQQLLYWIWAHGPVSNIWDTCVFPFTLLCESHICLPLEKFMSNNYID